MYALKSLSKEAIPAALQKAERYRLLNEPYESESICLDILETDPDHQEALIMLLLARTDLFGSELEPAFTKAREVLPLLNGKYCRAYYSGIIFERRAKAHLVRGGPGSGQLAYAWFVRAMEAYDQAMTSCDPGNQDAVLRWNTCARILNENPEVVPGDDADEVQVMDNWD